MGEINFNVVFYVTQYVKYYNFRSEKYWDGLHSFFVVKSLKSRIYFTVLAHSSSAQPHSNLALHENDLGSCFSQASVGIGFQNSLFLKAPQLILMINQKVKLIPIFYQLAHFPSLYFIVRCPPLTYLLQLHYNLWNTLLTAPIMHYDLYAFINHGRTLRKWPWKNC